MNPARVPFPLKRTTEAILLAIDIKEFSAAAGRPGGLLIPRTNLLDSIEDTAFFGATHEFWATQFLGDELRIAFQVGMDTSDAVIEFLAEVTEKLKARGTSGEFTKVVGVVVKGGVKKDDWGGRCEFLTGKAVTMAQRWMRAKSLLPGEIAFDRRIAIADSQGWEPRSVGDDTANVRDFLSSVNV